MAETQNKNKIKQPSDNLFPVVGVGASAGGLEAFKKMIKVIPETSGMAFILVQHLEPTHESLLSVLLQKITNIPVHEITNDVRVEPDHIYIIPSNKLLTANDGILQLSPRLPKNIKNMPVDVFFTSLAEVHQSHAIGVVLSGTGTDGTLGLKSIKEHEGITFAQDTKSTSFSEMPQSAIDADVVDFILTPEEIILQLIKLHQTFNNDAASDGAISLSKEDIFRKILSVIRINKGADFTYYKQTTIRRRIIRRMELNRMENISNYLSLIQSSKEEQDILYQDLLIPVTDFFRDSKIYDSVCEKLFALLVKDREESKPLRIWIAGCSTGEEPYSLAICLHEYLEDKAANFQVQIFATDISEKAIIKARSGTYTKKDIVNLSEERLEKYFTKVNGDFQVNKFIRSMCVFACHNFLKDPPFAKMDLVSCRNVLIYMEPILQKKALTTFHYALKENGYLLLGKSESIGAAADLFSVFNKNEKLYIRKNVQGRFPYIAQEVTGKSIKEKNSSVRKVREDFQKNADDLLLSKYSPPGVVVNELLEIVQFRGSTGKWLEAYPGKPSLNILKMAKDGLGFEIRNALHQVRLNNKPVVKNDISIQDEGTLKFLSIEVIPLIYTVDPYYLILFKDSEKFSSNGDNLKNKKQQTTLQPNKSQEIIHIKRLENEIIQVREDMMSISEDQESANEELQSANEELLSGSEELQSLNEELETSKEEIQSTNEELTSLNQELYDRNEQLNLSRIYAESIVATIREPLIIINENMLVKTANKSYYDQFKTTEHETENKLFYEIGNGQWNIPALHTILEKLLVDKIKVTGFEIRQHFNSLGERVMLLNASKIFRKENTERLILLAIDDVTETKKLEADLKKFTNDLEELVTERTIELKDANTLLKHSNENLEQFATLASHDLQEPLRKIMTFANLLNQRHSNNIKTEAKELLNKINVSAQRMSALIKDVLNFSRIVDSEKSFEKADLDSILNTVISDFDLLIKEKKALISHNKLPVINAIPIQINQLFYNLLSNALKFSSNDLPPEISILSNMLSNNDVIKNHLLTPGVSYCEIVFRDNGIGFSSEFSEQIFLIFQRLNSREHFEGTGIGLALCKRIVLNHHGDMYAESNVKEGAAFHIILPIK